MKTGIPWRAALKCTGPRTLAFLLMFLSTIWDMLVPDGGCYPYSLICLQPGQKMLRSVWIFLKANYLKELVSIFLNLSELCMYMYICMYICVYNPILYNTYIIMGYNYTY